VKEQTAFTRAYLDRIPQRDAIRRRLTTLWNASATGVPWREAGRLFFTENPGLQQQPALYEQDGRQDGRDREHWLRAEAEVLGRSSGRRGQKSA